MRIQIDVTDKMLADALCSALEGGSSYWIQEVEAKPGKRLGRPWGPKEYTPSYIAAPFSGELLITVSDEGDENSGKTFHLDRAAMKRGLAVLAEKMPRVFAEIVNEEGDATTGDCFLQACLFGDVVYG